MPVSIIEELNSKELLPGFAAKMACMEKLLFSHWTIRKGAQLPEHHHVHEQVSILIEGLFEFVLEGEKHLIKPGMVVLIPSNAVHSGQALTDCIIMDIFTPVRTDYMKEMSK